MSPGGENLLDFLELQHVLSKYDGDLRDPLWGPQERPFPIRGARGLSRFLFRRCWGLRTCVESVPEPEDSSPVLTCILRYFWSLPRGSQSSSRVGACTFAFLPSCSSSVRFPSRGSRDLWLSLEASSRGFPTRLSHVPPWCESILGLKVEAVQGKQFSLE